MKRDSVFYHYEYTLGYEFATLLDIINVLESGKIIEEGNHDGLLAQDGHYGKLYNTYFRHQSLAYVEQARELAEGD